MSLPMFAAAPRSPRSFGQAHGRQQRISGFGVGRLLLFPVPRTRLWIASWVRGLRRKDELWREAHSTARHVNKTHNRHHTVTTRHHQDAIWQVNPFEMACAQYGHVFDTSSFLTSSRLFLLLNSGRPHRPREETLWKAIMDEWIHRRLKPPLAGPTVRFSLGLMQTTSSKQSNAAN